MAMRDYSRLFGIGGQGLQRKRQIFGASGPQDMFGDSQHAQAVVAQEQEPSTAEHIIGGAAKLGAAGIATLGDTGPAITGGSVNTAGPTIMGKAPINFGDGILNPQETAEAWQGTSTSDKGEWIAQQRHGRAYDPEFLERSRTAGALPDEISAAPSELGSRLFTRNYQPFGGFRRFGGPVDPRRRYIVGENGPEMFVPDVPGQIVPNDQVQAGDTRLNTVTDLSLGGQREPYQPPVANNDPRAPQLRLGTGSPAPETAPSLDQLHPERNMDPMTPREAAYSDIQDLQRTGPQKESSFWKRVGQGVQGGLAEWAAAGAPGGIGGALGAIGAGATIYGASKGAASEGVYRQKLGRLFGKYKEAVAPEMAELDRLKGVAETQGKVLDVRKKGIETLQLQHKPFYDSIIVDKRVTPDEVVEARRRGIELTPYDAQRYGLVWVDGEAYSTPEVGPPAAIRNKTLPDKRGDYTAPVTVDDGKGGQVSGYLTGPQRVKAATDLATNQSRTQLQQQNQQRMQSNSDRDFQLRREQFDLSKQREGRIREEAARKYAGKDAATLQKRQGDLDKARLAIENLRAEAEGIFSIPTDQRTTEEQAKLTTLGAKEQAALRLYNEILKRMEGGN